MTAPPALPRTDALGPSGPFPSASFPDWVWPWPGDSPLQTGPVDQYETSMLLSGWDADVARGTGRLLAAAGVRELLWGAAFGGHGRRLHVSWDLRAFTAQGAEALLLELAGPEQGLRDCGRVPLVEGPLGDLTALSGVVTMRVLPVEPRHQHLRLLDANWWSRMPGGRARLRYQARWLAYLAVAAGPFGATMRVAGTDLARTQQAAARLSMVVLADLSAASGRSPAPSPHR